MDALTGIALAGIGVWFFDKNTDYNLLSHVGIKTEKDAKTFLAMMVMIVAIDTIDG